VPAILLLGVTGGYAISLIRRYGREQKKRIKPMTGVSGNPGSRRRSVPATCFVATLIAALIVLFVAMFVFRYDDGDNKSDLARAGSKTLETGAIMYRQKFGENPKKLDNLVSPPDGSPFVEPSAILDPWGRPYQYDPAGPRNEGKRPDIWTTGSDGKQIGNWPQPRRWWD
jgi:general secretion pathway protein G